MKAGSWKAVMWESSGKGAPLPLGDEVGMLGQRECTGKGPECLSHSLLRVAPVLLDRIVVNGIDQMF